MPSILIVDDETIFRSGLKKMIGEIDSDWIIAGEARDGIEALELVKERQPDAILTDIRMPKMDGIQLQKTVAEQFSHIVCVVISGYDDFMYVQQSIRQGAKDYIMKPIEREELRASLNKMKEKIRQQQYANQQLWQHNNDRIVRVKEQIENSLRNGKLIEKDLRLIQSIHSNFDKHCYGCIVIQLDMEHISSERYMQADPSLFSLYLQQIITEMVVRRGLGYCCSPMEEEVVVLLNTDDEASMQEAALQLAESIRRQLQSLSDLSATIGIGLPALQPDQCNKSYQEAKQAIMYRILKGGNKIYFYSLPTMDKEEQIEPSAWTWECTKEAFHRGDENELFQCIEGDIHTLCEQASSPQYVHQEICSLFLEYYELANQHRVCTQWLLSEDVSAILGQLCSITSREQLIQSLGDRFIKLTRLIHKHRKQLDYDPIERVMKYIEQNYNETLTLSSAAQYVHLNAAYLSSLFKQRTGTSFVERLNEIRIQEAKRKMLHHDAKLVTIAEQTGFSNIRHFNRVFKNVTGMAPSEFKEQKDKS